MNNSTSLPTITLRDLPLAFLDYTSSTKARRTIDGMVIPESAVPHRIAIADRTWLAMSFENKEIVRNHINRIESVAV